MYVHNRFGFSPLHYSSYKDPEGCIECIKLLLLNEANVNIRNDNGSTPLHLSHNYIERAKILISNGAEINGNNIFNNI